MKKFKLKASLLCVAIQLLPASYVYSAAAESHQGKGRWSVALGDAAKATENFTIALGSDAEATQISAISIGTDAKASGIGSVALGYKPEASGKFSLALGSRPEASKDTTIAIGHYAKADGEAGIAIGPSSNTDGRASTVIGPKATVSKLTDGNNHIYGDGDNEGNKNIEITDGKISTVRIDSENREELIRTKGQTYGAVAVGLGASSHDMMNTSIGAFSTAAAENSTALGMNATATAKNSIAIGPFSKAKEKDSIALGAYSEGDRENSLSIGFKGNERQIIHLAAGSESTDAVNVSQLEKEAQERRLGDEQTLRSAHNYTNNAINDNNHQINIKFEQEKNARIDGDKKTLALANDYTNSKFSHVNKKIMDVEKRANSGIAGATALSSIPYVNSETFSMGAALGHYRNAQALAVGVQYKPSSNTNVRLNTSWNNGGDTNIGAGFAVGW